jgi:hypothetical protein
MQPHSLGFLEVHRSLTAADVPPVRLQMKLVNGQTARPISTGPLRALPRLHVRPIKVVVSDRPSVPLSRKGELVSGEAWRLDAFSAYPFRAWLPGYAAGATTGTP